MRTIRLATRGSRLALVQAHQVKRALEALGSAEHPITVEIREVITSGDRDRIHPLAQIGGKGLFVRGIEEELCRNEADIAVHCGKDLPYELLPELVIAGVPEAADMRDLLISRRDQPVLVSHETNIGGREYLETAGRKDPLIGTGSPRRITELRRLIPDARFAENRGNVTTRLRKLSEGQFDAIVLAKAGIDRLGLDLSDFSVHTFQPEEVIPAACQGILAIECRREDTELCELLARISDPASLRRFTIERYLFSKLMADCSMAVGVSAQVNAGEGTVTVSAMLDGRRRRAAGPLSEYESICDSVADTLRGAT